MASVRGRTAIRTTHGVAALAFIVTTAFLTSFGVWGAAGGDPGTIYPAMHRARSWGLIPLAALSVVTGVLLGWPLRRQRWVRFKLVGTLLLMVLIVVALGPTVAAAAELATTTGEPPSVAVRGRLAIVPAAALGLLVVNAVLGVRRRR